MANGLSYVCFIYDFAIISLIAGLVFCITFQQHTKANSNKNSCSIILAQLAIF
jgi:hypothetical protein